MGYVYKNKGYIVSLYKRVPSANLSDYESLFDFIAFMNFDGIAIEAINSFEEYVKLPSLIKVDTDDNWDGFNDNVFRSGDDILHSASCFCEQQNLLLYTDDNQECSDSEVIFSGIEMLDYPVLLITLIEFEENSNNGSIMQNNTKKMQNLEGIKHCVFGSLGSADYVIVTRAKTFLEAFLAIETLRSCDENLRTIYTIPAILRSNKEEQIWVDNEKSKINAGKKMYVSLRFAINPNADMLEVSNKIISESGIDIILPYNKRDLALNGNLIPAIVILGKYDIEIIGTLEEPKKFLDAFSQVNGIFNAKSDFFKKNIYTTNTKLMLIGGDISKTSVINRESRPINIDVITNYIDRFRGEELKSLTSTERILLVRLLLKIIHIKTSLHKNNADDEILKLPELLIDKMAKNLCALREDPTEKCTNETNEFYEGLKCALVYLDNRIMIGRKDFEAPHGAWLSLGESSSLMTAYSALTKEIAKSLEEVRNYKKGEKEQVTFNFYVNAVSSHEVELFKLKDIEGNHDSGGWRYGFFKLPYGIINKIDIVIILTLHEAGHLYRCDRKKRNKQFIGNYNNHKAQGNLVTIVKHVYQNIAHEQESENEFNELSHYLVKKTIERISEKYSDIEEEKREDLVEKIELEILEIMLKYSGDDTLKYYFDNKEEDRIRMFVEEARETIVNLSNQWSEAFADIYLVKTLNIKAIDEYVSIYKKIFKMQKGTMNFEPGYFIVRYAAVLDFVMLMEHPDDNMDEKKIEKIDYAIKELGLENYSLSNNPYILSLMLFLKNALMAFGNQIEGDMEKSIKYKSFSEKISKHYKSLSKKNAGFKEQYTFFSDYNSET